MEEIKVVDKSIVEVVPIIYENYEDESRKHKYTILWMDTDH